jgi:hypothetical protein
VSAAGSESEAAWLALASAIEALGRTDDRRALDAAIYARKLLDEPPASGRSTIASTKLGNGLGTVVVKWRDGKHGTRVAPAFLSSIDEVMRLVGDLDDRVEFGPNPGGATWWATIDLANGQGADYNLAMAAAGCRHRAGLGG